MINELAKEIHQNAIDKGFYEKERNIGEMLALIHSEVSEALEADRNDNYWKGAMWALNYSGNDAKFKELWESCGIKGSFQDELADIVIRVFDLAEYKGIDLEAHIRAKMRYNSLREKYHGKKY